MSTATSPDDVGHLSSQRKYTTALASFVPETVKRYILQVIEHTGDLKVPQSQSFETVALFADVSGFTALTDLLAKKGPLGAEEIGFYLNRYLEQLVKIISRSGGDVFKFAGDAIVVLWPPESADPSPSDLADLVHRAASCSLNIQTELHNATLEQHVTMSLKLGIGVGRVTVMHVGGVHGRIEYLPAGAPLMQAFRAEHAASPGEAIMSIEAWRMVETKFTGSQIDDHNVRLTGCTAAIRNISVRRTALQWKGSLELLQMYVPAAVLPYLRVNQKLWSAELRQVSVVFVNLAFKLEYYENVGGDGGHALELVQKVISSIQNATYRYEGSLNKFLVDDKGSTLLIVFGLPPLAHENDPTRAVLSSLAIAKAMRDLDLKSKIGVTSGLALCGLVGSGTRREYSVLGDLVNLSARLMQASDFNVLCDQATFLAARTQRRIQFTALAPISVKGKSETVVVHRAELVKLVQGFQSPPACPFTVGRRDDIDALSQRIARLIDPDRPGEPFIAFVTGEIGSGKTHVLRHLSHAYDGRARIVWGRADPFSTTRSLHVFKVLFANLTSIPNWLGAGNPCDSTDRLALELALTAAAPADLRPVLDVLNPLLGTEFPGTAQSRAMMAARPDDRYDVIFDFIVLILRGITSHTPLVVMFDECQWMGADAWRILGRLCDLVAGGALPRLGVVVGTRPIDQEKYRMLFEPMPPAYADIRRQAQVQIELGNLGSEDVRRLIQSRLNGIAADDRLTSLVFERTGGRPLFCFKFIEALLHVNALVMGPASCHLSAEWITRGEWDTELPIPYRIQRITASHLDRLTPSQTMLLKVASVICIAQGEGALSFPLGMVRLTNPIYEYVSEISDDVAALIKFGVLLEEPQAGGGGGGGARSGGGRQSLTEPLGALAYDEDGDRTIPYTNGDAAADAKSYRFAYGFVRDFLYQVMLYKQRQKLHRICCDYIEAHLHEAADVEQEQMVLGRHVILSGAVPDQIDEQSVAFGNNARKSTIIPSQMSQRTGIGKTHRRIITDDLGRPAADYPDGSGAPVAAAAPDPARSNGTPVPVPTTLPRSFLSRVLCCAGRKSLAKVDHGSARRSQKKLGVVPVTTNGAADSVLELRQASAMAFEPSRTVLMPSMNNDDDADDVRDLKVSVSMSTGDDTKRSMTSYAGKVVPAFAEAGRASSSLSTATTFGKQHQHTSIGILQELHRNPALGDSDRSQIAFVLDTMTKTLESPDSKKGAPGATAPDDDKAATAAAAVSLTYTEKTIVMESTKRSSAIARSGTVVGVDSSRASLDSIAMSKIMSSVYDIDDDDISEHVERARKLDVGPVLFLGIDQWDFDLFGFADRTQAQPLYAIGFELFYRYDLVNKFAIDPDTLVNFLVGIEYGYNKAAVSYHNSEHATDVTQTMHVLLSRLRLDGRLTDTNLLAIVVACLIHDYRHPGQTNQFLVNIEDERAILFNDIRVLENFHCTAAFRFMRMDRNNILRALTTGKRQQLRQEIISFVLATSLVDHQQFLETFNATFTPDNLDAKLAAGDAERNLILTMVIKCADISNSCKPRPIAIEWARRIMIEFYNQGDVERSKGLPVSRFMDRSQPCMAQCQLAFINMFVQPLFQTLRATFPEFGDDALEMLRGNLDMWKSWSVAKELALLSSPPRTFRDAPTSPTDS